MKARSDHDEAAARLTSIGLQQRSFVGGTGCGSRSTDLDRSGLVEPEASVAHAARGAGFADGEPDTE